MNKVALFTSVLFMLSAICRSATEEKTATSTLPNAVCELDNSCKSTSDLPPESTATTIEPKIAVVEKWRYNVSEELSVNDTINIVRLNETNGTLNFDIDVAKVTYNKSAAGNVTKPANTKYQIEVEHDCFCDTTRGGCDVNCCCDRDCIHVNRNIFQSCNKSQTATKDDECLSKILNSPLLCIVKDNLYSKHFYPQYKKAAESTNVEKLLRNREVYGWSMATQPSDLDGEKDEFPDEINEYQFQSPVLTLTEDFNLQTFRLPKSTIVSRDCGNTEPVGYLENYEITCTHRVKSVSVFECEDTNSIFNPNRYYKNFSLIVNPSLINLSFILDHTYNIVNITPLICDDFADPLTCKPLNLTAPQLLQNNVCEHAVTSVHYKILHNGTEGILAAQVYFHLENVLLKPNLLWAFKFKLTFEWFNQSDSYELSGYPGYVFGKPIITAYKKTLIVSAATAAAAAAASQSNRTITRSVLKMSPHPVHWLTTFSTDAQVSECLKTGRQNVFFQENLYTRCSVPVPQIETVEQCETLQHKIFSLIFGSHINVSNLYISSYGAPNIDDSSNWVPLSLALPLNIVNESCSGLVTSVKLVILHVAVGDHDNPQQTIVAAKVKGVPLDGNIHNYHTLSIQFAVNFYDVTNPPLRIFAEPPTYEIKLPTDFFYPFFSHASCRESSIPISVVWIFLFNSIYYLMWGDIFCK